MMEIVEIKTSRRCLGRKYSIRKQNAMPTVVRFNAHKITEARR